MYLIKKHSWRIASLATIFLLNGCIVAPYDGKSDYLSKQRLSTTSDGIAYDTTVNVGYHIVRRGETLYGISRRYGFSYHDVAAWNNIYPPYTIWPGQQLLIYAAPVVSTLNVNNQYPTIVPASYHAGITPLSYRSYSTSNVVPLSYSYSNVVPVSYTTRHIVPLSYDHSDVVPANYKSSYIVPLNYRTSTTLPVYYSTSSDVPVTQTQKKSVLSVVPATEKTAIPESNFHTVRSGESLASIADSYGLTTYELALWNDITSPYTVYSGQQLLIVEP